MTNKGNQGNKSLTDNELATVTGGGDGRLVRWAACFNCPWRFESTSSSEVDEAKQQHLAEYPDHIITG